LTLEIQGVIKKFGGITAVNDVSMLLDSKLIYGLIGPNGSGKTTLFNLITGFLRPDLGRIVYNGTVLNGKRPHDIVTKGIGRTFQLTRLFPRMTVLENLEVVPPKFARGQSEKIQQFLGVAELESSKDKLAVNLSFGERKQLELVRVLLNDPDLIMLDEPMAGLTQTMIQRMINEIRFARSQGKTIFVIEHNLGVMMEICEKLFVMDRGRKIFEGTTDEAQKNKAVIQAYFGED
jgi:ABC-type branched-subunit amino acid transport system ATPase component